jgi:hypothetical protein
MALLTDSSTNNFQLSAFGNAAVNTTTFKYGGGSSYFDGNGDYLMLPLNPAFDLGSEDFTIEFWFNTTNPDWQTLLARWGPGGNAIFIGVEQSNQGLQFYINNTFIIGGGTMSLNQWYHVAMCRSGASLRLFLDGVQISSTHNIGNGSINSTTEPLRIGADNGINPFYEGYIDDVRITKGVARYTANFTPPTQQLFDPSDLYGDNVSLLLHMDGLSGSQSFTDSSTNSLTLTAFGNTQVNTSVKKFGTGAAYFDGTGDYLQTIIPNWNPGVSNEPFTIEFWVYRLTTNLEVFISKHGGTNAWNTTNGLNFNFYATSNQLYFNFNSGGTESAIANSVTIPTNQWTHLAAVYDGSITSIFVNGIKQPTTSSNSYFNMPSAPTLEIGGQINGTSFPTNGYIDELRITKGVARYTANFAPQTAPFAPTLQIPLGYIAFWKLDNLTDSSTNANTLTNNGSVQFVAGKIGNCAQFTGSNSVYLQDSNLTTTFNPGGPSGSFTASIWVNPASFSNYQAFIGGPNGGGFIIHTDSAGAIYCNEASSGDAQVNGLLQLNQWQHIVFIKSMSSGSSRTKVWYNGSKVYDQPTSNVNNYDANVPSMTLGNFGGLSFPYNGKLDMVGLWNRELTEQEILDLYNYRNGLEP